MMILQTHQIIKIGQEISLQKKIQKQPTSTRKDAQHYQPSGKCKLESSHTKESQ